MKISILLFARAKELAGAATVDVEVAEGSTIADVRQALIVECPALSAIADSLFWAVNNEYVTSDHRIKSEDVVASFPAVSGG